MKSKNPIGKRREKQKAETYALILVSARFLFDTKGFEKTTIRKVASHAEVALGTIYKHFENKTSLLAAAFYDDLTRLYSEAIDTMPDNLALHGQFTHLVGFNYRYYTSRPTLSREYLSHIALADNEWLIKIEAFDKSYFEKVTTLVCAAQQRGEIKAGRDCHFIALSLMADYFFVLGDLFLKQKNNCPEEMLTFLNKMIDQIIY